MFTLRLFSKKKKGLFFVLNISDTSELKEKAKVKLIIYFKMQLLYNSKYYSLN